MFISRREYERLEEQVAEWRAKYEEERYRARDAWEHYYAMYNENAGFFLKDYELAVMWPKGEHNLIVWNHGRFEEGVRSVELSQDGYEYVPYFKMVK